MSSFGSEFGTTSHRTRETWYFLSYASDIVNEFRPESSYPEYTRTVVLGVGLRLEAAHPTLTRSCGDPRCCSSTFR